MSAPFAPADELTVGSICTGYGGVDAALSAALGARTVWVADNDGDVSKLLVQRFAHLPNLGDITKVDWASVPRVRILAAGFPCQDVSPAGHRAGIQPGNRSGLWTWITYVIRVMQPQYVFIENSKGLNSAKAHSDVEHCPLCMGDAASVPALRALGRVLGDLADLGYDAEWVVVRASDVGAPHDRARAFVWAWRRGSADPGCRSFRGQTGDLAGSASASSRVVRELERVRVDDRPDRERVPDAGRELRRRDGDAADAAGVRSRSRRLAGSGEAPRDGASGVPVGCRREEPADTSRDGRRERRPESARVGGRSRDAVDRCAASDADSGGETVRDAESRRGQRPVSGAEPDQRGARAGSGTGSRHSDVELVQRDSADSGSVGLVRGEDEPGQRTLVGIAAGGAYSGDAPDSFVWRVGDDDFTQAIRTWEAVSGRRAPYPAIPNRRGDFRLNPRFSEWMMGVPDGWVTGVAGLSRAAQLRIVGNGLVPVQGALAIRILTGRAAEDK